MWHIKEGHIKGRMLTAKQEKFVRELVKGKSQKDAYRAAYPNSKKWKDNSVFREASVLLKKPKVSQRYEELKADVASKTTYDVAEVRQVIIDTLMAIVTADVADDAVDGRAVKNKKWDSKNRVVYEHYDKIEAAKMLREMLGIDTGTEENGVHIHLHHSEDYDG